MTSSRIAVTLAATDDLSGVAYRARREHVQKSLERSVQAIRAAIPELQVDWDTVSAPAQLVVGDAPRDRLPALTEAAREVGVLVNPLVNRDVAL